MSEHITVDNASEQAFIPVLRELVRAYQAFTSFDAVGYRDSGLTVSQADVIFTLGNTDGMTFKEIGALTLITKGTLTGVIDRLEEKKLVKRITLSDDRRCTQVLLTTKGNKVFAKEFPRQIAYIKTRFDRLSPQDLKQLQAVLQKLRTAFE